MVDINLIGDDQTQFEPDENEREFQDAYGGEPEDFSQDTFMRSDTFDTTDYGSMLKKRKSKTGVIVLFIIVMGLLAATAYVLFKPSKTQQLASQNANVMPEEVEAIPVDSAVSPAQVPPGDLGTSPSGESNIAANPSTIPANVLNLIKKSYNGYQSINTLVNSLPASINFTSISYYNDGKVLFEILSADKSAIDNIDALLRQRMPGAKISMVSTGIRSIKGHQYYQAILTGELSSYQTAGPAIASSPRYLSSDEMTQLLNRLAEKNRVKIVQITPGKNKISENVALLPITVRITGLKDNLLRTLGSIIDENVNVSFVKILLIARETELGNPQMTLVLNVDLFQTA